MKDTVLIGICGRSGSGKSFVSAVFSSFGGLHIDTDRVYHKLLEPVNGYLSPCAALIAETFGSGVVRANEIDRPALAGIVFSDREKLDTLNRITHKFIKKETKRIVRQTEAPFALIDAPVLFESGFDRLCGLTVCVVADDETCISRICKRDGVTEEEAAARLASQLSCEELERLCDYSIDNSSGKDVVSDVRRILEENGLI